MPFRPVGLYAAPFYLAAAFGRVKFREATKSGGVQ